jgi:hypothetical protein
MANSRRKVQALGFFTDGGQYESKHLCKKEKQKRKGDKKEKGTVLFSKKEKGTVLFFDILY